MDAMARALLHEVRNILPRRALPARPRPAIALPFPSAKPGRSRPFCLRASSGRIECYAILPGPGRSGAAAPDFA